jgi:hypothetical protein
MPKGSYSAKQRKLAAVAPPRDKITAADLKKLRSKKKRKKKRGRAKYNRATGSNLQAPVTEKNPTGKRAARRKSFCARMKGVKGPLKDSKGRPTRKALALKRWRC